MSENASTNVVDTLRWTFSANPEKRADLVNYLTNDLGLDVMVREDGEFVVLWDEPGVDEIEGVVEELWEINGEPFEVTHEEFRRLNLFVYQTEEAEADAA
jgi:hypothetical protein